eukprot:COSAG02_NODE_13203_length_1427_cov_1.019578_2_plen_171_part_00
MLPMGPDGFFAVPLTVFLAVATGCSSTTGIYAAASGALGADSHSARASPAPPLLFWPKPTSVVPNTAAAIEEVCWYSIGVWLRLYLASSGVECARLHWCWGVFICQTQVASFSNFSFVLPANADPSGVLSKAAKRYIALIQSTAVVPDRYQGNRFSSMPFRCSFSPGDLP